MPVSGLQQFSAFLDQVESDCKEIHAAVEADGGDYWGKRIAVAAAFGYFDAKYMRFMHETHGLHIADQVIELSRKSNLKIPWLGLASEFRSMGMKESAIDSMLKEAKEFVCFSGERAA